jgi:hypothetical protein
VGRHRPRVGAGGETLVDAVESLLAAPVDVVEPVAEIADPRPQGLAHRRGAVDPGALEEEPGAGGEGHAVEAGVEREGSAGAQELRHRTVLGPGRRVARVAREAELDVVSRQLAHRVAQVGGELDQRRRAGEPLGDPGPVPRLAVGVGVGHEVPFDPCHRRRRGRQARQVGGETVEHRRPHRLVGVTAGDQADAVGPAAEAVADEVPPLPRDADAAGVAGGGRAGLRQHRVDVEDRRTHPGRLRSL